MGRRWPVLGLVGPALILALSARPAAAANQTLGDIVGGMRGPLVTCKWVVPPGEPRFWSPIMPKSQIDNWTDWYNGLKSMFPNGSVIVCENFASAVQAQQFQATDPVSIMPVAPRSPTAPSRASPSPSPSPQTGQPKQTGGTRPPEKPDFQRAKTYRRADQCVKRGKPGYFDNGCNFKVMLTYCSVDPAAPKIFSCAANGFGSVEVGPLASAGTAAPAGKLWVVACEYPGLPSSPRWTGASLVSKGCR